MIMEEAPRQNRRAHEEFHIPKLDKDDEAFINSLILSRKQTKSYLAQGVNRLARSPALKTTGRLQRHSNLNRSVDGELTR